MAAEQLSGSIKGLFSVSPTSFLSTSIVNNHGDHEAQMEAYLSGFELPVLRDPLSLSLRDIPPPTYCPVQMPESPNAAAADRAVAAAAAAAASGPQQHQVVQAQDVKWQRAAQWQDSSGAPLKEQQQHEQQQQHSLLMEGNELQQRSSQQDPFSSVGGGDQGTSEEQGMHEQQQQQQLMWGPKGLIDGSWFLGGPFGPASILDISGVMRAKHRAMEEVQQPVDDVLPLPLKFLHCQVALELNGDENLLQQDTLDGAAVGEGGWQVTATEAAFEGVENGRGGATTSCRAVRSRWQYLLQRTHERLTGLPVIPRRLPENDTASAAARAARQRPWCQRQLKG